MKCTITLFEYNVIIHLCPILNSIQTIIFNHFIITKSLKIKIFISKKQSKLNLNIYSKIRKKKVI